MSSKSTSALDKQDYADGYVLEGDSNSANHLVSSLTLLLREQNYIGLYDASVLFSPEKYLRQALEFLDRDTLFRTFVFLNGFARALDGFSNLLLLPVVSGQVARMAEAAQAAVQTRRQEYQGLPAAQKADLTQVYEQLLKVEPLMGLIARRAAIRAARSEGSEPQLFEEILSLVVFLSEALQVQQTDPQDPVAQQIAARTIYELLINKRNIAVYTRNDDVRKLISTFYKLINTSQDRSGLRQLDYFNIVVLKYDGAKRVYRRFFESATDKKLEAYHFPRRISEARQREISDQFWGRVEVLDLRLRQRDGLECVDPTPVRPDSSTVRRALQAIHTRLDTESEPEMDILEAVKVLALDQQDEELAREVDARLRSRSDQQVRQRLRELEIQQAELQQRLRSAIECGAGDLSQVEQIAAVNQEIRGTWLRRYYLARLIASDRDVLTEQDYPRFITLLERFHSEGYVLNLSETCVPTDQIARLAGISQMEVIDRIEAVGIRHEGTRAFIEMAHLLDFL